MLIYKIFRPAEWAALRADGQTEGAPIDIYNNGNMYRHFTYVKDLVRGIRLLIDLIQKTAKSQRDKHR